jgi:WD40 repeat protein
MRTRLVRLIGSIVLLSITESAAVLAQETRLNLFDPAVVLATGGRMAACDALLFTPGGEQLLAVGDDKCVHLWDVQGNSLRYTDPAWWNSFRERRGSIFALAISPDGERMVVGGFGRLTADVVIFRRRSRLIEAALSAAIQPGYAQASSTVWALAFHPTLPRVAVGQGDGSVWVWDYQQPVSASVRRVAAPLATGDDEQVPEARCAFVAFAPSGDVWFARRGGDVFSVPADGSAIPRRLFSFDGPVAQALMTADSQVIVARSAGQRYVLAADGQRRIASTVEVRTLPEGKRVGSLSFPATEFPDGMGLDPQRRRFALGIKRLDAAGGEKVFREGPGFLRVYEITESEPRLIAEAGFGMAASDVIRSFPEAIAFHPDGKRIAVAAGIHHETSLWTLENGKLQLQDISEGVGKTLWEVRASEDGTRISFRSEPLDRPTEPNHRGTGPWRTFDLKDRFWVRGNEPQGNGPLTSVNGWRVEPDSRDQFRWQVVSADGRYRYPLPLDQLRDFTPICYTFLPATTNDATTRLAVGHYWGYSLFAFAPEQPPRRIRRGVGHHGYVTSIVPAVNGRWLVTASRDETICIWSTEDWRYQSELGADFEPLGIGESAVKSVDPGSPAWEIGLIPGDRIRKVYRAARPVDPFDWAEVLERPTPGEELAFEIWRFADQKTPLRRKTSLLQRPVWRFLPTAGADWVLYRYQDYVYDSSANGDTYLGWLLGGPSAQDTPQFTPAERYRAQFRRPSEVRDFVTKHIREPSPFFRELLPPPQIHLKLSAEAVPEEGVTLEIVVRPPKNSRGGLLPIEKVELWLGDADNLDHQLKEWPGGNEELRLTTTIRPEELRIGDNRLVVVAYSHARSEQSVVVNLPASHRRSGVLRGIVIGINRYRQIGYPDLTASVNDARLLAETLTKMGREKPFAHAEVLQLTDEQATPQAILEALERTAQQAAPDDWLVLFLAGHGSAERRNNGGRGDAEVVPGSWYFVGYADGPAADYRLKATDLFQRLKRIRCRKLILLDSCHSGAAIGVDGGRDLRPDDKGPVVLTAAAPHEEAGEDVTVLVIDNKTVQARHGFFTAAVYNALGPQIVDADRNRDRLLTLDELFEFTRREVIRLRPDQGQTVTMAPWPLRNVGFLRVEATAAQRRSQ